MAHKQTISGTQEWCVESVNCVSGCSHDCRYCYARANAVRFKQIKGPAWWSTERVRQHDVDRYRKKLEGRVMFPTSHDITPAVLEPCLTVIEKLLAAGNELLIVSKPHGYCIRSICRRFEEQREQILFRFTIGAMHDPILRYWEPGAPCFGERLSALMWAFSRGFGTSVSIEPMLDSLHVVQLVRLLYPWVSAPRTPRNATIWIGKMNQLHQRVAAGTSEEEIRRIEEGQTDEQIKAIYSQLQDWDKVRWKESIKKVVGLDLAERPGLDV